jgi:hypothetical protein
VDSELAHIPLLCSVTRLSSEPNNVAQRHGHFSQLRGLSSSQNLRVDANGLKFRSCPLDSDRDRHGDQARAAPDATPTAVTTTKARRKQVIHALPVPGFTSLSQLRTGSGSFVTRFILIVRTRKRLVIPGSENNL